LPAPIVVFSTSSAVPVVEVMVLVPTAVVAVTVPPWVRDRPVPEVVMWTPDMLKVPTLLPLSMMAAAELDSVMLMPWMVLPLFSVTAAPDATTMVAMLPAELSKSCSTTVAPLSPRT
jgi:hypothetical protein